MFQLRDYQLDAVEQIRAAFRRRIKAVLYVLSTGGGKSRIFSYIAEAAARKGNRVVILVHHDELLGQNVRAFEEMGIPFGVISPHYSPTDAPLQLASIWTLAKRLDEHHFDLAVFDEAHHLPSTTFTTVYEHFRDAFKLMVTATPERLDGRGLKDYTDEIIVGPSMKELCDRGYLARSQVYAPSTNVDLSKVRTRAGDFAPSDLEQAMDKRTITGSAVEHYARHIGGHPAVCFCVSIAHAEHVAEQFREAGWPAASIDVEPPGLRGPDEQTLRQQVETFANAHGLKITRPWWNKGRNSYATNGNSAAG